MTRRVVVTGAAGFVGSHVVERLLVGGDTVVGVDNFDRTYDREHKERAVARFARHPRFRLIEGDARRPAVLGPALERATLVVHAAGRAGVRESMATPARAGRANVGLTAAVLAQAERVGLRRIVHLSSSSVYGNAATPFDEADGWLRPASPYAASKRGAELLMALAARRGCRVAILRLFSVYGPGQRPDQAAWRFAVRLAAGEPVDQYGDGSAVRDFTYVGDVAEAVYRAAIWTDGPGAGLATVNIGAGRPERVDQFRATLAKRLACVDQVRWHARVPGDVASTVAATDHARATLDWSARTSLADGLAAFAEWFEVTHGRTTRTTARSGA